MGNIDCCASTAERKGDLAELREVQSQYILYNSENFSPRDTTKSLPFALFKNEDEETQLGERLSSYI